MKIVQKHELHLSQKKLTVDKRGSRTDTTKTVPKLNGTKMWILYEVIYYECTSSQLSISVITFGWVCCCTHPKVMTDMLY